MEHRLLIYYVLHFGPRLFQESESGGNLELM